MTYQDEVNNDNVKAGRDGILIVFPDYEIDPDIGFSVRNPFTGKQINWKAPQESE